MFATTLAACIYLCAIRSLALESGFFTPVFVSSFQDMADVLPDLGRFLVRLERGWFSAAASRDRLVAWNIFVE